MFVVYSVRCFGHAFETAQGFVVSTEYPQKSVCRVVSGNSCVAVVSDLPFEYLLMSVEGP